MADVKITALPAGSTLTADDLFPVVNSPGSGPGTQRYTAAQVQAFILAGYTFASLSSKPTTLAGYGITDGGTGMPVALRIISVVAVSSAVDTANLQAGIDAATPGGVVVLDHGATYQLTAAIQLKAGVLIQGNHSTLQFTIAGDLEALQIRGNYCGIINATINVTGSGLGGTGGNLHTPINVGQTYANIGYSGVLLKDLTISGNRPDGNGILVSADSSNVRIENITFPDSAQMSRPILIHWGGDGAAPPALTTHPNNIIVENIKVGTMTYTGADGAAVFISAAYNVHVRNVKVKRIYGSVISVVTGDYGFQHAAAAVKPLANQAIEVDGVTCEIAQDYGVFVNSVADNAAGTPIITTPVILRNIMAKGIGTGAPKSGFRAFQAIDVTLENCHFSYHLRGFELEESSKNIKIRGGSASYNEEHGVYASHAQGPQDCIIEGVNSYLNGQSASGFWAGIYVGSATRIVVRNCQVGHPVSETEQIYGIRTDNAVTALSLIDNYVHNTMATGIGYSLGSGGDDGGAMIWEFRGNGAAPAVPNFRNGATRVPIRRWLADVNAQVMSTEYMGDATIPTTGAWVKGDEILWDVPPASGNRGIKCTATGSQGTWVTMRNVFVGPTAPSSPVIDDLWVDTS